MTYKQRARALLDRIEEYNADYGQILADADTLLKLCLTGMVQEKVAIKDVVKVTEVYPQVAKSILDTKLAVLKELSRVAELEQQEISPTITVNILDLESDITK